METNLYAPVKKYLESLGFSVKGEIGGCDLVALAPGEPPVVIIGELKLSFNLELVLQGVDRAAACNEVWLAVPLVNKRGRANDPRVRKLCRRLGFGLLVVAANGHVDVAVSPAAAPLVRNNRRRSRLVEEHRRRKGDPVTGGSTRKPVMTAYRQQALTCAAAMRSEPRHLRDLVPTCPDAAKILQRNVYGWFERQQRGIYMLTAEGLQALEIWPQDLQIRPQT